MVRIHGWNEIKCALYSPSEKSNQNKFAKRLKEQNNQYLCTVILFHYGRSEHISNRC